MLQTVDDLIARMADAATERALNDLFRAEMLECGYIAYDAFSHVLDARMAVRAPENFVVASYDLKILGPYLEKGMAEICPGLTEMCASITPFEYINFLKRTPQNTSVVWQRRILAGFGVKRAWCVPLSNLGVMQGVTVYQRGDDADAVQKFADTRDYVALAASYYMEALLSFRGGGKSAISKAEGLAPLSPRELDCLEYVSNGQTNRNIASALLISENTVNFHLKNVYRKLRVTSRMQAIVVARRLGLLEAEIFAPECEAPLK
ncbi:MAG: LuxR C-terminal-related transcriptional regulator [Pikeienuella sp.]